MNKNKKIYFETIWDFLPYATISILLILGIYSSDHLPVGEDSGKYFTVIKAIVN